MITRSPNFKPLDVFDCGSTSLHIVAKYYGVRSVQLSERTKEEVEQVIDSIFSTSQSSTLKKLMINNVRDIAVSSGHKWKADQKFDYHKSLPWGDDFILKATGSWNNTKIPFYRKTYRSACLHLLHRLQGI